MFTGIIEAPGRIKNIERSGTNIHINLSCPFVKELQVDQSIAHNGACLTVVELDEENYKVTAIEETLNKTNLGDLKEGDLVNLERCTRIGGRLDGHLVQGHVDQVGVCRSVEDLNGSWRFSFSYTPSRQNVVVDKGSICINGVSLTVIDSREDEFSVAVIPYTFEHTNFHELKPGQRVNLEFDIIGKYVARLMEFSRSS